MNLLVLLIMVCMLVLNLAVLAWKFIKGEWPWSTLALSLSKPDGGLPQKRYNTYALGKLPSGKIEEFVLCTDTTYFLTENDFETQFMNGWYDSYLNGREVYQKNKKTGLLTRKRVKYVGLKFSRCVEEK